MNKSLKEITFGEKPIRIEDVIMISKKEIKTKITKNKKFLKKILASNEYLNSILKSSKTVYGVNTGYGESCTTQVDKDLVKELPSHLTRFHGCGLGDFFTVEQGRAILAVRLASLVQGVSGARLEVLEKLNKLLMADVIPVIPQEGSVGASGDLTPLSYVAAALLGERESYFKGKITTTKNALKANKIKELPLKPKEALAIMNGTSVMTAIACLAFKRAQYLSLLTSRVTAMLVIAMKGNPCHFDPDLFALKPHPGQVTAAARIYDDLYDSAETNDIRIQDRYSIRCAPHIIGVLEDSLIWVRSYIEIEINSSNDNPLIDGLNRKIMHGGHFYGGHIAFAMDSLKNLIANLADLCDRQFASLMDASINKGLTPNLSGAKPDRLCINHGLKAVQIAASAWSAEALKNTMPASVFSRSTESHNQDKVSMGTIASRDCLRVLELTEQVVAATIIATKQAIQLRLRNKEIDKKQIKPALNKFLRHLESITPFIEEDRPLDKELNALVKIIQNQKLNIH